MGTDRTDKAAGVYACLVVKVTSEKILQNKRLEKRVLVLLVEHVHFLERMVIS